MASAPDNTPCLLIFAAAFMGCVLSTPLVTRLAAWAGAIDRPDQFRRIHRGAIPRLGGLAVAAGLGLALVPSVLWSDLWACDVGLWLADQWPVLLAGLIVLALGAIDDTRGVNPRTKLLVQTLAVLVLIAGDIRITEFRVLNVRCVVTTLVPVDVLGYRVVLDPLSTLVTLAWFLACMNIWNLIDGMDGLASGVGLLVSGTLMVVAMRLGNNHESAVSAVLAAALAGGLAGFLLYNWHPACIFLGDSGSLLIGLLIGVMGVQSSMKSTAAVSTLFPILAMGLPISDTAMAIVRRWVRDLPLSSADRRHIHHLLIGLGLNPRQAAILLYCLTGFLCGVVLLGSSSGFNGDLYALIVGTSGCLAFLLILMSRRDELSCLMADFRDRLARKRQERQASRLTWESIQKIELCPDGEAIWAILLEVSRALGCDHLRVSCLRDGRELMKKSSDEAAIEGPLAGSVATFRLKSGEHLRLTVTLHHAAEVDVATDIAFRALQRLSLATAQRLERLTGAREAGTEAPPARGRGPAAVAAAPASDRPGLAVGGDGLPGRLDPPGVAVGTGRDSLRWFRWAWSRGPEAPGCRGWLGEK